MERMRYLLIEKCHPHIGARTHHLTTWPHGVDDISTTKKVQFKFLIMKSTSKYDLQKILTIKSEGKSDKEV